MFFYISIFLILLFLALSFNKNLSVLILSSIGLIIIASFRGINIGVDTHAYYEYFLHSEYSFGYMELIWNCLNYFVYKLGFNFNVFLLFVHSIIIFIVVYVSWKETKNPQLALFFYYAIYAYCNSFNGLRQYLAISIVLLAFYFLKNSKNIKFCIIVLLASLVHYSAVLAFLPLIFVKTNINLTKIFCLLIISFIIGMFFPNIDLDFLLGKYVSYSQKSNFIRETEQGLILCVLMNIYFIIFSFTSPKEILKNIYYKIFLVGILLMNITIKLTLGSRVILYFTFIQIILIPIYFEQINAQKFNKTIVQVCFLLYFLTIFLKILILGNTNEYYSIYPYYMMVYN